jgi:hypothetical protein
MTNVTGWDELMEGSIFKSVFNMYDAALNGWFIAIVFFTFQSVLYIKTKNTTLTWVTGLLFASLYAASAFMNEYTNYILFITLVIQLAGIFFMMITKK